MPSRKIIFVFHGDFFTTAPWHTLYITCSKSQGDVLRVCQSQACSISCSCSQQQHQKKNMQSYPVPVTLHSVQDKCAAHVAPRDTGDTSKLDPVHSLQYTFQAMAQFCVFQNVDWKRACSTITGRLIIYT